MLTEAGPAPALSSCEREPIHVPGSIQSRVVLLVLTAADGAVVQASANTAELLGVATADVLGQPLDRVLGADTARRLAAGLAAAPTGTLPVFRRTITVKDRTFHAVARRSEVGAVLEFELAPPADPEADPTPDVAPLVDAFTLRAEAGRG